MMPESALRTVVRVNAAGLSADIQKKTHATCSKSQVVEGTGPPAAESSNRKTHKWDSESVNSDREATVATPFSITARW